MLLKQKTKMMIHKKLKVAEQSVRQKINAEKRRMEAIISIKKLLEQIDFKAEVVPVEDRDKLGNLLVSLKGDKLDVGEVELVGLLTDNEENENDSEELNVININ